MASIYIVAGLVILMVIGSNAQQRSAICDVRPDPNADPNVQVKGTIKFTQANANTDIMVNVDLKGFKQLQAGEETKHGVHVHVYGNTVGSCTATGGHYNPGNVNHGAPNDAVRHAGDFGNLNQELDGTMVTSFSDPMATLFGDRSIIGRAMVVHAGVDDLGRGNNTASRLNGNAGARLACCVIGRDV